MKTLPPCDHDECPLTRCLRTEAAQAGSVERVVRRTLTPEQMAVRNALRRIKKAAKAIMAAKDEERMVKAAFIINEALVSMANKPSPPNVPNSATAVKAS